MFCFNPVICLDPVCPDTVCLDLVCFFVSGSRKASVRLPLLSDARSAMKRGAYTLSSIRLRYSTRAVPESSTMREGASRTPSGHAPGGVPMLEGACCAEVASIPPVVP